MSANPDDGGKERFQQSLDTITLSMEYIRKQPGGFDVYTKMIAIFRAIDPLKHDVAATDTIVHALAHITNQWALRLRDRRLLIELITDPEVVESEQLYWLLKDRFKDATKPLIEDVAEGLPPDLLDRYSNG